MSFKQAKDAAQLAKVHADNGKTDQAIAALAIALEALAAAVQAEFRKIKAALP